MISVVEAGDLKVGDVIEVYPERSGVISREHIVSITDVGEQKIVFKFESGRTSIQWKDFVVSKGFEEKDETLNVSYKVSAWECLFAAVEANPDKVLEDLDIALSALIVRADHLNVNTQWIKYHPIIYLFYKGLDHIVFRREYILDAAWHKASLICKNLSKGLSVEGF